MTKAPVNVKRRAAAIMLWLSPCVGLAPAIIGGIGASLTPGCNESNCYWGVLPWATFMTLPIGFVLFIIGIIMISTSGPKPPVQ